MGKSNVKRPKVLSATFVKSVNQPGRYGDGRGGHGLSLLVKPMSNGRLSKTFSQRLRVNGRPVNIGLGAYPVVTLAEARAEALENRRALEKGRDPRAGVPTFAEAVEHVIRNYAAGWKDSGKSEAQWRASLRDYAIEMIGHKRVCDITTADLLSILLPYWQTKNETMRRVWQRIGAVMKWSIAQGYRKDNPAGENLRAALPKNSIRRTHQKALPHDEVSAALAKIRNSGAYWATVACFEFMTLTATRSGEARLARWEEVDLEMATWTIPAERMKAKRFHRVPLSDAALDVLDTARRKADDSGLIFPSVTGKPLSDSTISKLVRENGIGCVPHGMRSSFRDWAAERTDVPREVCELALAHVNSDRVEVAYRRTDLYLKRAELMQRWTDFLRIGSDGNE